MKLCRILLFVLAAASLAVAQKVSGTIPSTGGGAGCVSIGVFNQSTVKVQVTGTWSGTLQPEISVQGQTAANTQVVPSTSSTAASTITANGVYTARVAGGDVFLVCGNTVASGTANIYLNATQAVSLDGVGGGALANALTGNNSNTGAASGTTFDGSVARTFSANTFGAVPLTGTASETLTVPANSTITIRDLPGASTSDSIVLGPNDGLNDGTQKMLFTGGAGSTVDVDDPSSFPGVVITSGPSNSSSFAVNLSSDPGGHAQLTNFAGTVSITLADAGTTVVGKFVGYNGVSLGGQGLSIIPFTDKSAALTANYNGGSAKTIVSSPTAGSVFLISGTQQIVTAATSSSTFPSLTLGYTDAGGIARTLQLVATSTTNATTVITAFSTVIYVNATNVTLTSASYASSGATAMKYALAVTVQQLI